MTLYVPELTAWLLCEPAVYVAIHGVWNIVTLHDIVYVIVISQAGVGYHCYYTRLRAKAEVEC